MKPLYFKLGSKLPLMVIPDTIAHLDGHPILSYTYSIYHDHEDQHSLPVEKEGSLHLEKNDDPDYLGFITFEAPDKLFSYTPNDGHRLDSEEVEEVIEYLSHLRGNPDLWKFIDN